MRDVHNSQQVTLSNAKDFKVLYSSADLQDQQYNVIPISPGDTLFWEYKFVQARLRHEFDITNFPFDSEVLTIGFEENIYTAVDLRIQVDSSEVGISDVSVLNWRIDSTYFKEAITTHKTSFGDPANPHSTNSYSSVGFHIPISRNGNAMFWKLLTRL